MAITRKVIFRMQWWTSRASPAKRRHSTADPSGKLMPRSDRACQSCFLRLFPCYCAVTEAVLGSWCVVTHIEGAICQSVTLVSLLMSGRAGVIGEQCGLDQSKYRNTQIKKYRYTKIQKSCNQNSIFLLIKAIMRKGHLVTLYHLVLQTC